MKQKQNNIAIQLTKVSKKYEIHHEKPTLVESFIHGSNETFWALRDITLTAYKGERVGIIGSNGSGKTTLLKLVAQITSPTSGTIFTSGNVVSLIDLGAGFHSDLSGYENIYLNGAIIGLTRKEIEASMNSIIAFADLKQFIDAPIYTYSSGMILRLAFSVAIHASPDILILDEGLSVGDNFFRKKVQKKIQELFKKKITILLVSHDVEFIRTYCTRVLHLEKGTIKRDGTISVIQSYLKGDSKRT